MIERIKQRKVVSKQNLIQDIQYQLDAWKKLQASLEMAVKKRQKYSQLKLSVLAKYVKLLNDPSLYLHSPPDVYVQCDQIMHVLSRTPADNYDVELREQLQIIEEYFLRVVHTVPRGVRRHFVTRTSKALFNYIIDKGKVSPVVSVVLVIFDVVDPDYMLTEVRDMVTCSKKRMSIVQQVTCLVRLLRWCYEWHLTPSLGDFTLCFIKVFEEIKCYDVLVKVSLESLGPLFGGLRDLATLCQSVANLIFHIMAALRYNIDALDKLSPHIGLVLTALAEDSGPFSRQLLQNVVDILSASIKYIGDMENSAENGLKFKEKYDHVLQHLERHMASRDSRYLQIPPWGVVAPIECHGTVGISVRTIGLQNLGNTCYMNSVMQTLFATKSFSSYVIMKQHSAPYWSRVAVLFAKMLHSVSENLNPEQELRKLIKPLNFPLGIQHDSSEFLMYLFELLKNFEYDTNVDFVRDRSSRPPRMRAICQGPSAEAAGGSGESSHARSTSPRPGSSNSYPAGKRPSDNGDPPRKKKKTESMIDVMFSGVLNTRVRCQGCDLISVSRDGFRDLQLAFPEKPHRGVAHTVQNLIEYFCSKEQLCGENQYFCTDCGGLRDAEKTVMIETTPKFLILVLKNFKFEPKLNVQRKLTTHPLQCDQLLMLPTNRSVGAGCLYHLYATVIHSGVSINSGHYYAMIKDNDNWITYSDETVWRANEKAIDELSNGSTPYIMFYRRDDVEEPGLPSFDELPENIKRVIEAHNKNYFGTAGKPPNTQ